jgi:hypothetical protein
MAMRVASGKLWRFPPIKSEVNRMNKISKKRLISRKRTLAFAFLLTLLFLLTIQDARGETFADSHTIGSTMNTHFDSKDNQTVSIQAQNTFWAFLNQVAGLDTNTYNLDRFIVNNHAVEGSKRIRTSINSIITTNARI